MLEASKRRIVRHILAAESGGRYTAINANTDGAGVSVGLLQWSQAGGGLSELLEAWLRAEPDRLATHLGPDVSTLLAVARQRSLAPVRGEVLWSPAWLDRWRRALSDEALQAVQDALVVSGVHMRAAVQAAQVLNLRSERGLALLFDRAVQQGPSKAKQIAEAVRARLPAADEQQTLYATADAFVEPFRRTTAPDTNQTGRLQWKPVGDRWHLHSGSIDLYATARRRVNTILVDPAFDQPSAPVMT